MTPTREIFEVMAKHDIEMFNIVREDLFTYTLLTDKPVGSKVLKELKTVIGMQCQVVNEISPHLTEVKQEPEIGLSVRAGTEDNVNHPSHYNQGQIEVIEYIEDKDLGYHRGNAIKYLSRMGKKEGADPIEDLKKARWYIDRLIERMQAAKENRNPTRPNQMTMFLKDPKVHKE